MDSDDGDDQKSVEQSRREQVNQAFSEILKEERSANQAKTLREHNMKLLNWPPPTNRS